ncbi:phage baseplate protein [Kozakia baliensis]|uniref:phage baseplate protein n=1 Tax=Kozakia baliensis TaxID=153496 RepID=UPI00345BC994
MAFPIIALPSVWDIPVAAGVPALLGQSVGNGLSASVSNLLGQTVASIQVQNAAARWGLFNSAGFPVLTAAHVMGIEYESGCQISDAPTENGGFVSYNKVKVPFSSRIIMVCDGSEMGFEGWDETFKSVLSSLTGDSQLTVRKGFFDTLETIVADTNLYTIVTPERSYMNANIVGYRFRRTNEGGITMAVAEIALQEVRQTATLGYSQTTKEPAGAETVQIGNVQAQSLTPDVAKAFQSVTLGG